MRRLCLTGYINGFSLSKDLERGFLSEDLLPLDELRELANSPLIPKGNRFVAPIVWYYSNLKVHMMQVDEELVYSIDLPLVSEEHAFATEFKVSHKKRCPGIKENNSSQTLQYETESFISECHGESKHSLSG
jgi:hypothetical protein